MTEANQEFEILADQMAAIKERGKQIDWERSPVALGNMPKLIEPSKLIAELERKNITLPGIRTELIERASVSQVGRAPDPRRPDELAFSITIRHREGEEVIAGEPGMQESDTSVSLFTREDRVKVERRIPYYSRRRDLETLRDHLEQNPSEAISLVSTMLDLASQARR